MEVSGTWQDPDVAGRLVSHFQNNLSISPFSLVLRLKILSFCDYQLPLFYGITTVQVNAACKHVSGWRHLSNVNIKHGKAIASRNYSNLKHLIQNSLQSNSNSDK